MIASDSTSNRATSRELIGTNGVIVLVTTLIIALDQITKHWAVTHLSDGHVDHVVWTLQFNLSFNSGMAFGRGRGWGPVIGVVAMLVVIGLVLSLRRQGDLRSGLGVGAIVGGALGNIVDRLFRGDAWLRGQVVDFIDLQWFPIFNVADMAVNIGGIALLWLYVRSSRRTPDSAMIEPG